MRLRRRRPATSGTDTDGAIQDRMVVRRPAGTDVYRKRVPCGIVVCRFRKPGEAGILVGRPTQQCVADLPKYGPTPSRRTIRIARSDLRPLSSREPHGEHEPEIRPARTGNPRNWYMTTQPVDDIPCTSRIALPVTTGRARRGRYFEWNAPDPTRRKVHRDHSRQEPRPPANSIRVNAPVSGNTSPSCNDNTPTS